MSFKNRRDYMEDRLSPIRYETEYTSAKREVKSFSKVGKCNNIYSWDLKVTKPFRPEGLLIVGASLPQYIISIKIGIEEHLESAAPAVIFSIGLSLVKLKELISKGETIVCPQCISKDFGTINPGVITTVKISGEVQGVVMWGLEAT